MARARRRASARATVATRSGLCELAGREVDAHWTAVACRLVVPAAQPAARLAQHPAADRHDQAGLLGQRDELAGRRPGRARVLPAHERLDAAGRAAREVDHAAGSEAQLVALERAAQRALESRARSRASARMASSKTSKRPRPRSLARYIAASASRIRSSAADSAAGAARCRCSPCRKTSLSVDDERLVEQRRRCARRSARASASPATSSHRTANSSPPKRATVSAGRSAAAQPRRRRRTSSPSPAAWPSESLIELEAVEVEEQHGDAALRRRRARRSACSRRSRNSARLGSPVSGSCSAWWASSASAALALGDVAGDGDDLAARRRGRPRG